MSLPQSKSHIAKIQTATSYSNMTDLQLTGPAVQTTPNQTLTCKSVQPISSLAGAALSQDPDSDLV